MSMHIYAYFLLTHVVDALIIEMPCIIIVTVEHHGRFLVMNRITRA